MKKTNGKSIIAFKNFLSSGKILRIPSLSIKSVHSEKNFSIYDPVLSMTKKNNRAENKNLTTNLFKDEEKFLSNDIVDSTSQSINVKF